MEIPTSPQRLRRSHVNKRCRPVRKMPHLLYQEVTDGGNGWSSRHKYSKRWSRFLTYPARTDNIVLSVRWGVSIVAGGHASGGGSTAELPNMGGAPK